MIRRWSAIVMLIGVALAGWACGPNASRSPTVEPEEPVLAIEEAKGPALFEDITGRSGVKITYRNGEEADHFTFLESVGGGVGVLDFDGDGLPDLFITGGGGFAGPGKQDVVGLPCKLFRNRGDCRFEDVTAEAGLDKLAGGKPWFYTHGVAVADFDRDGRPDLLVLGWGRIALFRNVDGKRFEDVSEKAGLGTGITWAVSAAWADLDGDGYPDLYVCQYVDWSMKNNPTCFNNGKRDVCTPLPFGGLTHKVYRNNGDGTFTDVSATCGLVKGGPMSSKGLGVLAVDVDGDGKPDLYVCNDGTDKFLYLNKSVPGKILLEERGLECGVARDEQGVLNASMGVDAGDYDGSGKPSLWVTNFEHELHGLYKNTSHKGRLSFHFDTREAGIAAVGQPYVGWGTSFIDFDLDGWEDLFVSNGHAIRYPNVEGKSPRQKPVLYLNQGKGKFLAASKRLGTYGQGAYLGRGVGFVDLDNDGRVDLVLNHMNEPAAVLRNVASEGHHWLGVQLAGARHADVVGARVVLDVAGRKQTRFAKGGASFASSADRRLVFGLGKADRVDKLEVVWPDGSKQEWSGLGIDRYHVLTQGKKEPDEYRVKK